MQNLAKYTDQISVDLSGGFDSRLVFVLLLKSGIDLNKIRINSIQDGLHTHAEDYEIASSIAGRFGFALNKAVFSGDNLRYSLEDVVNIAFYTKMAFHKEMYWKCSKFANKRYSITGSGGEAVRAHWDSSASKFLHDNMRWANRYHGEVASEISDSIEKIIRTVYKAMGEKYNFPDADIPEYPLALYKNTRCRSHFGKGMVENFLANSYTLTPLMDPILRSLQLNTPDCQDNNLLMAVIYMRYCPELLDFKFEGGRFLDPKTVEYAKKLNQKFPVTGELHRAEAPDQEGFHVSVVDEKILGLLSHNNSPVTPDILLQYMKSLFDSTALRKVFGTCFDESIYMYARGNCKTAAFHPMRHCYPIIAFAEIIRELTVNESIRTPVLVKDLDWFVQGNGYIPCDDEVEIVDRFRPYLTARLDVKLMGEKDAVLEVVSKTDKMLNIKQPAWMQKEGVGYVMESCCGVYDVVFHSHSSGALKIGLKSRDVRNENGERIAFWVDYKNCTYNGEALFSGIRPASHDRPIVIQRDINAEEEIRLHVEWTPHIGIPDEVLLTDLNIEHEKQLAALRDDYKARLQSERKCMRRKMRDLKHSHSYRIGRCITWPIRKLKQLWMRLTISFL